jgi:alpha-L-rhamnosidase
MEQFKFFKGGEMTTANKFAPFELKCDYSKEPLGMENLTPAFSWRLKHTENNQYQKAYRIIMSDDIEQIKNKKGNLWDTGKITSQESANVNYKGHQLNYLKRYYWRVRWWDKNGKVSPFSEIATFETGIGNDNWKAKWISGDRLESYKSKEDFFYFGVNLRKDFKVKKDVESARIYISGLGYYELYINGERVGDRLLDPGQTDYKKMVLYSTYDITGNLKSGGNTAGVTLGNGRYIKKYGYDRPKLLAEIHIRYTDGTSDIVLTDKTWKAGKSAVRENGVYLGEVYDARLYEEGWALPNFNDKKWTNAVYCEQPGGRLVPQTMPPIKDCGRLKPVSITNPEYGVYVFDFGQNFTGWVRLYVEGRAGDTVNLKFAEVLDEKGRLNLNVNRQARATDVYILKGNGTEVYEPHFTYHGFRYVEVTGYPGVPGIETLEGIFIHTAVEPAGSFLSSNALLNKIHRNIIYGQLSNLMSIPTDCPQRAERMGWMGDAQLTAEEAIYNFDMEAFYTKYLDDISLSQREDGSISDVVPPYWSLYPADPAWGTAYITIAYELYRYFNDTEVLRKHYQGMKKYVDFLSSMAKDELLAHVKYGDWCPPGSVAPTHTPREITSAFSYYHDVLVLSEIARIIGTNKDHKKLIQKTQKIKEAYNKKYLDEKNNAYGNNDQTSNTLGLQFNLAPEDKKESIVKKLVDGITIGKDFHFDTGIVGTKYILDALCDCGYKDVAYKIMTQESYPSFGYMIKEGATTVWERWEKLTGSGMNSHNHIMFGTVDAWFYRYLAGIRVAKPGWEEITIKPFLPEGLKHVSASLKTLKGYIKSSWEAKNDENVFEIEIPVNTKADVYIPASGFKNIKVHSNGVMVDAGNIKKIKELSGIYHKIKLGSGTYKIITRQIPAKGEK